MAANSDEHGEDQKQQPFPTQNLHNREDCPTPDLLRAVASKSLPFDHPVVQHVGLCDFCLEDVNRLRAGRKRRRVISATTVLLALAVVTLGLLWWHSEQLHRSHTPTVLAVDLRPFTAERGDSQNAPRAIPIIPRQNLKLSFTLPLGLEAGQYEIRLMDEQLHVVRETRGQAGLRNYEVQLSTEMDLSSLTPGEYRLWIRQGSQSWRDYPLRLQ
jgi:hypothetical protein